MAVEDIIKKVPKAPKDIDKWIREYCATGTYIIYDKKQNKAVCTRCGRKYEIGNLGVHNLPTECNCGHAAMYKAAGRGRKNIAEYFRVMVFTRRRNKVYATLTNVILDFQPFGQPEILTDRVAVYTFDKSGSHYYKYDWWDREYYEIKNIRVPHAPKGCWWGEPKFEEIYIYRDNLEDVFCKSDLKYLWDKELIGWLDAYQLIQYISLGMQYQAIEMLYKAGFKQLVMDKINRNGPSGAVNWKGKTLQKILRLDMGNIRRIRQHNPSLESLKVYQKMTEAERAEVPWETVRECGQIGAYLLNRISKYASPIKVVDYVNKQRNAKNLTKNQKWVQVSDWPDYIEAAEKIGQDITKKRILFPKSLKIAHDTAIGALKENENKETSEKIKKRALGITYEKDGLMIVEADSVQCLHYESAQLGHCVRTYTDRVAEGRCKIFFIRKTKHPDKSFYTLETDPKGKFVQCRGKSNCSMTHEVAAFKDDFIKYLQKELKKKARKAA